MTYPNKPPPRPNAGRKSYDDLQAVSALDAAESRLRAAMQLADDEAKRADAEEIKTIILRSELETIKAAPKVANIEKPASPEEKKISISPNGVTVRGQHWKFTLPLTLLLSLFPLIWTGVSDYLQLKRDLKTQTESYARISARVEEVNVYAHEVGNRNAELRETVAELSGYLAGVLPLANIKVKQPAGSGTPYVASDPLPIGAKRITPVIIRTPIPTPEPTQPSR